MNPQFRMFSGFECFLTIAFVGLLLVLAWRNRGSSRDLRRGYAITARAFHGKVERGHWAQPALVRIPYGLAELELTTAVADNGRRCTEIRVLWPEFRTSIQIYSQQITSKSWRHRKIRVQLGDAEFNRQFTVTADDPAIATPLLTGGVRRAVQLLARVRGGGISIRLGEGELVVQKLAVLEQPAELAVFVRHAMELYDQLLLSGSEGIEFVDKVQFQLLEDAKCPVCCEPITDDLVFCGQCRTPHHRECWLYTGKCATYACGETQFVVNKSNRPR